MTQKRWKVMSPFLPAHAPCPYFKVMRPASKAGTGAVPLSTSGCVGRSSGGRIADTVGKGWSPGWRGCPRLADGRAIRKAGRGRRTSSVLLHLPCSHALSRHAAGILCTCPLPRRGPLRLQHARSQIPTFHLVTAPRRPAVSTSQRDHRQVRCPAEVTASTRMRTQVNRAMRCHPSAPVCSGTPRKSLYQILCGALVTKGAPSLSSFPPLPRRTSFAMRLCGFSQQNTD